MNNNILLKHKQTRILLALKDPSQSWYISTLAKATNTTYVHACNFLAVCESLGITQSEKHGKLKIIKLTDKGQRIVELISNINLLVNVEPKAEPKSEPTR